MKLLPLAALALLATSPAFAQKLSKAEGKAVAAIESDTERTLAFLEKIVVQNSGTMNFEGVRKVHELVAPDFEALGFAVEWKDVSAAGRSGHTLATHKGNGKGKRILLIGHLDTVFEPSSPFQGWKREGDRVTGPGVVDDKGGIAVILSALRGMQAAGTLKNADIVVILTGDEEKVGDPVALSRKDLIEAGQWADVALEFESLARENGKDYGTVARRSSSNWTLTVKGKTGHSSTIFSEAMGYGAVYEMARILDGFRRELPEQYLTYNVSVVAGGTPATMTPDGVSISGTGKTNIIPENAIARGDLRSLTAEQDAKARAGMERIVAASLPGTSAKIEFQTGYPPMAPTQGNRALLAKLNAVNASLGLPEMPEYDAGKRGAADSSFVAKDADTIAGLGPWGGNSHAEGEWLDIPSIPLQAKRAAILMGRLAAEKR